MTDLIESLCERMARGLDLEPQLLASRLGRVEGAANESSIMVVPHDSTFSSARISVNPETGMTGLVTLVPAQPLFLPTIERSLGRYREGRRLHPFDPRKFIFSPRGDAAHPYVVDVVAYVSAPGDTPVDSASVEKLLISCSVASAAETSVAVDPTVEPWPRLLGTPARFSVRSLRATTIEVIRSELEGALGVHFVRIDGAPAFACSLPACVMHLTSRVSENPELTVFNFVGRHDDTAGAPQNDEAISGVLAKHLRSQRCDWYVPNELELLDESGGLGDRILDHETLVSTLVPRWLAWFDGEEHEIGLTLLNAIAALWISAAERKQDPATDVRRRRAEFMGWGRYAPPASRLRILASYGVQLQLSIIEEQLFELNEMTDTERAAVPALAARVAEWREVVSALEEGVESTGVTSIRSQYDEVLTAIDDLARSLRGGVK